jgi:putative colanic acid biosynthesis UDP-glucose lipid carrier transferase
VSLKDKKYSGYIRPFSYLIDFIIINLLAFYLFPFHENEIIYSLLISLGWFFIAFSLGFYEVYRYTKVLSILNTTLKQTIFFTLFCLAIELFYSE